MIIEKVEHKVARSFATLQENLDKRYDKIEEFLLQQGLKGVEPVFDAYLKTCYIQCDSLAGDEIRFTIPWNRRDEAGVKCKNALYLVDAGTSVNPYIDHCFEHYQRLDALEWIDMKNNDLIVLHISEGGFMFAFHRLDKKEIRRLLEKSVIA